MSLNTGIANLNETRKATLARWDDVKRVWADSNAQRFEEQVIEVIDKDLKQSLEAMSQMQITMQNVRRDCTEQI